MKEFDFYTLLFYYYIIIIYTDITTLVYIINRTKNASRLTHFDPDINFVR